MRLLVLLARRKSVLPGDPFTLACVVMSTDVAEHVLGHSDVVDLFFEDSSKGVWASLAEFRTSHILTTSSFRAPSFGCCLRSFRVRA